MQDGRVVCGIDGICSTYDSFLVVTLTDDPRMAFVGIGP
jgi:hypothetical protein